MKRLVDQCKAYGAAAIIKSVPGRLHISWDNDNTLKIETDFGTQTRGLHLRDTGGESFIARVFGWLVGSRYRRGRIWTAQAGVVEGGHYTAARWVLAEEWRAG